MSLLGVRGCLLEVAAQGFAQSFCEVTDAANVYRDVIFFRGGGKGEGVVLPDGNFRAAEENVLITLVVVG
jgi:hypothetical protein